MCLLRKNKLPNGKPSVSSFRVKRPSLGGMVEEEVVSVVAEEEGAGSSMVGGE